MKKSKALANLVFLCKKTCDELFGYAFINFGKTVVYDVRTPSIVKGNKSLRIKSFGLV